MAGVAIYAPNPMKALVAARQAALAAYWSAKTPQQETAALARLKTLGIA